MVKNLIRAALYIRVSTDDQTEFSPEAQKRALLAYANKENMSVSDDNIFIDEGKSGRTAQKRPEFMRMIGVAKATPKQFDAIIVHKFDRFARNREDSIVFKTMLRKDYDIRVISMTESINEDDKLSILIEALLEAMAEYYSINLAEEVKKGMTEKALRGGFQSTPSFGYYMKGGKLTIQPEEAEIIRMVYKQFLSEDKSPHQIAKLLNAMGIRSKRNNPIESRTVKYFLQNPVYIGKVRWTPTGRVDRNFNHPDSIIVDGEHEAIISKETFEEAKEKLARTAKKATPRQRPTEECKYWLSGLMKCSACGRSLTMANALRYPSYQCVGYNHASCKVSHSITIRKLETAVYAELSAVLENLGDTSYELNVAVAHTRDGDAQDEIKLLESKLAKFDDRLRRAKDAYLEGADTLQEYKENKAGIGKQQQTLTAEIKALKSTQPKITTEAVTQRFNNLIELLQSDCDVQIKIKAVRGIIDRIVYSKPNESLSIYYKDV